MYMNNIMSCGSYTCNEDVGCTYMSMRMLMHMYLHNRVHNPRMAGPHVHGVFKPSIRSVRAWYSQMNSLLSVGALSPINIPTKQPAKYIHVKLISIHVYST